MKLSYCVVNTNGRAHLPACLEAIVATHPSGIEHEILVLDNGSDDDSLEVVSMLAARSATLRGVLRVIPLDRRGGKAFNDTLLLREADGEMCLLLNEDSELRPGATAALIAALDGHPNAAAAGCRLLSPEGDPQPCAWRLPGVGASLASAVFLHRKLVTQSKGEEVRPVGWAQSAALMVRRADAEEVGWLDARFFVYSDETDFCKRLRDAGKEILFVPDAIAVHHEQLATDHTSGERRVVEFHRNRDLYMRIHYGRVRAAITRVLNAWAYLPRALAALVLPRRSPRWFFLHARKALRPRGEGLREAAERRNAMIARSGGSLRLESDQDPLIVDELGQPQNPPRSESRSSAS